MIVTTSKTTANDKRDDKNTIIPFQTKFSHLFVIIPIYIHLVLTIFIIHRVQIHSLFFCRCAHSRSHILECCLYYICRLCMFHIGRHLVVNCISQKRLRENETRWFVLLQLGEREEKQKKEQYAGEQKKSLSSNKGHFLNGMRVIRGIFSGNTRGKNGCI